jgi:tripartite-type tricarboxylate transporter receptor subunit TctC
MCYEIFMPTICGPGNGGRSAPHLFSLSWRLVADGASNEDHRSGAAGRRRRYPGPTAGDADHLDARSGGDGREPPGAGDVIGTEAVARAAPDGNTLLVVGTNFVITPRMRKVDYDPLNSFEPICHLANAPTIIVVNSASPYRTLADLLSAARAKPGELTLASIGPGGVFHLGFEMLKRAAKVDMTFVPYPGNAPALNAVLGQQVTAMFGTYSNVAGYLKAGTLRALAVATPTRAEPLPDVPTVAESGYKDFDVDVWFGAFAPANTPKDMVNRLAIWFATAMQAPEVKEKLLVQGIYPGGPCGADFAAFVRKQYDDYGRVMAEAKIKAE